LGQNKNSTYGIKATKKCSAFPVQYIADIRGNLKCYTVFHCSVKSTSMIFQKKPLNPLGFETFRIGNFHCPGCIQIRIVKLFVSKEISTYFTFERMSVTATSYFELPSCRSNTSSLHTLWRKWIVSETL